jgi:type II secretory pathway pseudopilin PulG
MELVIVIAIVGIMAAVALPRMRVSPGRRVATGATQLLRDLELARTRSLSTKATARVAFDVAGGAYQGFLDEDRNGVIDESAAEQAALRGFGRRELPPGVRFGRGTAGSVPGDTAPGVVTFAGDRVEFDARGITVPFGQRGTIYLVHRDHPDAVAAVTVSGSASFKVWVYRGGEWQ